MPVPRRRRGPRGGARHVIQARIAEEKTRIDTTARKLEKRRCSCRDDALAAIAPLQAGYRFHKFEVTVESKEIAEKRARRGRPPKGEKPPTSLVWVVGSAVVRLDEDAVERATSSRGRPASAGSRDPPPWRPSSSSPPAASPRSGWC